MVCLRRTKRRDSFLTDILRKASIVQGFQNIEDHDSVCQCKQPSLHELELSSRPHRWPEMRKLQAKFFDGLLHKVTEREIDALKILGLPDINKIRHAELTDAEQSGSDKFTLNESQEAAYKKNIKQWAEELLGTAVVRKQIEEDEAVYNYYMLGAFAVGAERTLEDTLRAAPDWMDKNKLRRLFQAASLKNKYLAAIIKEGGIRIKTRLAKDYINDALKQLRRMASEGTGPMTAGRWMHKSIGEGQSWYWNRIARTESALAVNGALRANAVQFKVPYVEWDAASTACEICMQFQGKQWKTGENPWPVNDTHPHCTTKSTKIYTLDGWKKIKDIKEGERVLTHLGKYKEVTQLHRHASNNQNMVELSYNNSPYMVNKKESNVLFKLTDNHPIMLNGEWVNAGKARQGDKIRLLATRCLICGKLIPFSRWRNAHGERSGFCSQKCNTIGTQRKYGSKYLLEKFQENRKQLIKKGKHHFQIRKDEMSFKSSAGNSKIKYNTKTEQILMKAMDGVNINYIHQFMVRRPETRPCSHGGLMNRFYKTDFAIPEYNIIIECNGKAWHKDSEYDNVRRRYIESEGFTVLNFWNEDIESNPQKCVESIRRLMSNHDSEYEFMDVELVNVRKYTEKQIDLYNLSVADDESYIAKGFVVHNCLCVLRTIYLPDEVVQTEWDRPSPFDVPYTVAEREALREVFG